MRVIFLSPMLTVAICFIVWPILQVGAALICLYLPNKLLSSDNFIFRSRRFEKEGELYENYFKVRRWKHLLPDGGTILKKHAFRKKKLDNFSKDHLNRFLIESARGELTHWLAIIPFWVFGFFAPEQVIWYMFIYALLANLPCIIAQRYNRPRVQRLLSKM